MYLKIYQTQLLNTFAGAAFFAMAAIISSIASTCSPAASRYAEIPP